MLILGLICAACSKPVEMGNVFDQPGLSDYVHLEGRAHHHVPVRCLDVARPAPAGIFHRPGLGCDLATAVTDY